MDNISEKLKKIEEEEKVKASLEKSIFDDDFFENDLNDVLEDIPFSDFQMSIIRTIKYCFKENIKIEKVIDIFPENEDLINYIYNDEVFLNIEPFLANEVPKNYFLQIKDFIVNQDDKNNISNLVIDNSNLLKTNFPNNDLEKSIEKAVELSMKIEKNKTNISESINEKPELSHVERDKKEIQALKKKAKKAKDEMFKYKADELKFIEACDNYPVRGQVFFLDKNNIFIKTLYKNDILFSMKGEFYDFLVKQKGKQIVCVDYTKIDSDTYYLTGVLVNQNYYDENHFLKPTVYVPYENLYGIIRNMSEHIGNEKQKYIELDITFDTIPELCNCYVFGENYYYIKENKKIGDFIEVKKMTKNKVGKSFIIHDLNEAVFIGKKDSIVCKIMQVEIKPTKNSKLYLKIKGMDINGVSLIFISFDLDVINFFDAKLGDKVSFIKPKHNKEFNSYIFKEYKIEKDSVN